MEQILWNHSLDVFALSRVCKTGAMAPKAIFSTSSSKTGVRETAFHLRTYMGCTKLLAFFHGASMVTWGA
jgi:hypothetical protein